MRLPSPAANRLAASSTLARRFAVASADGCRPAISPSTTCAGAVSRVGTGGSWDSPPDPMSSTRLSSPDRYRPRASPSARTRLHRGERRGDGVDEERHRRHRVQPAEEDLQGLHHAVVDLHPQRHREVDPAVERGLRQTLGDVPGHVERAWGGTEVADRGGGQADAELRHQLVEEAVVVVRAEDDDQFGVVLGDELAGGGERGFDVRGQFSRRLRELQQRAVRHG